MQEIEFLIVIASVLIALMQLVSSDLLSRIASFIEDTDNVLDNFGYFEEETDQATGVFLEILNARSKNKERKLFNRYFEATSKRVNPYKNQKFNIYGLMTYLFASLVIYLLSDFYPCYVLSYLLPLLNYSLVVLFLIGWFQLIRMYGEADGLARLESNIGDTVDKVTELLEIKIT